MHQALRLSERALLVVVQPCLKAQGAVQASGGSRQAAAIAPAKPAPTCCWWQSPGAAMIVTPDGTGSTPVPAPAAGLSLLWQTLDLQL